MKQKQIEEQIRFLHQDLKEGGMYDGKVSAEFKEGWQDSLQWLMTFINPGKEVTMDLEIKKSK